jgi:hypothetical protein
MKYIKTPAAITPLDDDDQPMKDDGGKPVTPITFAAFVRGRLTDPQCLKTAEQLFMVIEIRQKLKEADGVLELSDAQWELLRGACKEPSGGYAAFAVQVVPFIKAVLNASDNQPKMCEAAA